MWMFTLEAHEKAKPLYMNMVSHQCDHIWQFKCDVFKNAEPHTSHKCGLSPVHIQLWIFRENVCEWHEYGSLPVCVDI